jgi:hypothetical protein
MTAAIYFWTARYDRGAGPRGYGPEMTHAFKLGQKVRLKRPTMMREGEQGAEYEVTQLLPFNGHQHQYRLKSVHGFTERVATEAELVSLRSPPR